MPEPARKPIRLADLQQSLPGYHEAAQSALALRAAMFDAVSADDIAAIMAAQVKRAKEGDSKAAKFITDLLGQGQPTVHVHASAPTVTPLRMVGGGKKSPSEAEIDKADDTPRREVLTLLSRRGPLSVVEIAKALDYPRETISRAIGCDPNGWFALHAGKYGLTGQGREAAG